jgi:hypothetical protein
MSLPEGTDPLWPEYRKVIGGHICAGHDSIDTINRLLRKNPWLKDTPAMFQIPREGLNLSAESWALDRLWPLIHRTMFTDLEPASSSGAVLILRWNDREYLTDGRRRINHWKRNNLNGPHRALVVSSNDI